MSLWAIVYMRRISCRMNRSVFMYILLCAIVSIISNSYNSYTCRQPQMPRSAVQTLHGVKMSIDSFAELITSKQTSREWSGEKKGVTVHCFPHSADSNRLLQSAVWWSQQRVSAATNCSVVRSRSATTKKLDAIQAVRCSETAAPSA